MYTEQIFPILQEYDDVVKALQKQSDLYHAEHEILRRELIKLLSDNEELQKRVDGEFQKRMTSNESKLFETIADSEMVTNLRKQLEMSLTEREQLKNLYQTSQDLISKLERKVNKRETAEFPDNRNVKSHFTISALETKIEELVLGIKMEISVREDLEKSCVKLQTEVARLKVNLSEKTVDIKRLGDDLHDRELKLISLEQELSLIRSTLDCVSQSRDDLETAMIAKENLLRNFKNKINEAKNKVSEAVEVAEKAVSERDVLYQREIQLQEEIQRLSQCISHIMEDAAIKLRDDLKQARDQYNLKLSQLLEDFDKTSSELKVKQDDLLNLQERYNQLESLLEIKKQQTACDVESQAALLNLQSQLDLAEQKLGDTSVALTDAISLNEKLSEDADRLREYGEELREVLLELEDKVKNCRCKRLREKLKNIKAIKKKEIADLENQVVTQIALNDKWQTEATNLVTLIEKKARLSAKDLEKVKLEKRLLEGQLRGIRSNQKRDDVS